MEPHHSYQHPHQQHQQRPPYPTPTPTTLAPVAMSPTSAPPAAHEPLSPALAPLPMPPAIPAGSPPIPRRRASPIANAGLRLAPLLITDHPTIAPPSLPAEPRDFKLRAQHDITPPHSDPPQEPYSRQGSASSPCASLLTTPAITPCPTPTHAPVFPPQWTLPPSSALANTPPAPHPPAVSTPTASAHPDRAMPYLPPLAHQDADPAAAAAAAAAAVSQHVPGSPSTPRGAVVTPPVDMLLSSPAGAHTPTMATTPVTASSPENKVKGPWNPGEDALLMSLVEKYGAKRWTFIAGHIHGRTGKQARERWLNHLSPNLTRRPWTDEEDRVIMIAHGELGNRWCEIAKRLRGRTDNGVKNRYNTTIRRKITEYHQRALADQKQPNRTLDVVAAKVLAPELLDQPL